MSTSPGSRHVRIFRDHGARRVALLVCVGALLAAPSSRAQTPAFEYATSASVPILTFQERLGEIDDPDPGPSFVLYGDGRLIVHFPVYMKRAGDWTMRLSQPQVRALVTDLLDAGAADFDPLALREEMRAAGPRLIAHTDPSTLDLSLDLRRYRGEPLAMSIRWTGVRRDALAYPEIATLQGLAAMRTMLVAMMFRDGLERLP